MSLTDLDILDGARLLLHTSHDIDHMAENVIDEHGGFSPVKPRSEAP